MTKTTKPSRKYKQSIPKFVRQNKLIVFILSFALIGSIVFIATQAATPYSQVELDSSTITSPATKITDATASGGSAVLFGSGTVTPPTLPPGVTDTAQPADPAWKPDADNPNTGVKDYSLLKPCAAGEITRSGTASAPYVIENCDFTDRVYINADYVTIKNSRFKNGSPNLLYVEDVPQAENFVGENLDFVGSGQPGCIALWGKNGTIRNSDITNCEDGIKHGGVRFEYNWVHDLTVVPPACEYPACDGSHTDGMQVQGGMSTDMIVVGNNFQLGQKLPTWGPDKGFEMGGETYWDSAPCLMNIIIQNNWLDGRNTYWNAGIRAGTNTAYKCYPTAKYTITANRFYRQNDSYGTYSGGDVITNNVWHDSGPTRWLNVDRNVTAGQAVQL